MGAIDGTGLEARSASLYFIKKKYLTRTGISSRAREFSSSKFPFLINICDCSNHFIISSHSGIWPSYEIKHFKPLLEQAANRVAIHTILADAGYDSESNHEFSRDILGIKSIIPATNGRNKHITTPPHGKYRRKMWQQLDTATYAQRSQIETVNSMFKRRLGSQIKSRLPENQQREARLKVITHNLMILKV